MLTITVVEDALDDIEYKDWRFRVAFAPDMFLISVEFDRPDAITGVMGTSKNMRPWVVERWRSVDYLINTVFKAVATAEEHEMREAFKYKGEPRFSPHSHEKPGIELGPCDSCGVSCSLCNHMVKTKGYNCCWACAYRDSHKVL